MGLAEDIYNLYKDELRGNSYDEVAVVLSILDGQSRKHMLQLIEHMSDGEMTQMLGIYLIESLKAKLVQESNLSVNVEDENRPSYLH